MANSIVSNAVALNAQSQNALASRRLAASSEALASGRRVNDAGDDAAGLAIATRMGARLSEASQVGRGLNDGISLVQTADGGLARIHELLQRSRELAVQAASDTLSDGDRRALQAEYQESLDEVDRIANGNEAFGIHLLRGVPQAQLGSTRRLDQVFPSNGATLPSVPSGIQPVAYIPAGATNVVLDINSFSADDDLQLFTVDGRHLVGTPLSDVVWASNGVTTPADVDAAVLLTANGFNAGASYDASQLVPGTSYPGVATPTLGLGYNGMQIQYSGDGDYADGSPNNGSVGLTTERIEIDQTTEPLMVMVMGSGVFSATASWGSLPPVGQGEPGVRTGPLDMAVDAAGGAGADADMNVRIEQTPADTATLGLAASTVSTRDAARAAMAALDQALDTVSGYRATHGAVASRFERTVDQLAAQNEAVGAAQGRILDADYAQATAERASAQILADASQAMLAQARQWPEQVLALLKR